MGDARDVGALDLQWGCGGRLPRTRAIRCGERMPVGLCVRHSRARDRAARGQVVGWAPACAGRQRGVNGFVLDYRESNVYVSYRKALLELETHARTPKVYFCIHSLNSNPPKSAIKHHTTVLGTSFWLVHYVTFCFSLGHEPSFSLM